MHARRTIAALLVAGALLAHRPIPGAECFPDPAHPKTWQASIDHMADAQLEALDDCLDRAGWTREPAPEGI
jgi:hypothetical protein